MSKQVTFIVLCLTVLISGCSVFNNASEKNTKIRHQNLPDQKSLQKAFKGIEGTMVIVDVHSDKKVIYNVALARKQRVPCSTFKIWNSLIGLELSLVTSANESFYIWDGKRRFLEVMRVEKGKHGILYGKTGSGMDEKGAFVLGWFVGYIESGGKIFSFACQTQGLKANGKQARNLVAQIFRTHGLL